MLQLAKDELSGLLNTHPKIRLANEEDGRPNLPALNDATLKSPFSAVFNSIAHVVQSQNVSTKRFE